VYEEVDVLHADGADITPLVDVLARAFDDDPIVRWAFRGTTARLRYSPAFFHWSLRRHVPQDVSWTTADHRGAALWALPDRWKETPREAIELVGRVARGVSWRTPWVLAGLSTVEQRHPTEPHLYLAVLGVAPEFQGRGVGASLLEPGLALCDSDRLPAYLETSKQRNIAFYARHGFTVIDDSLLLPRGPRLWRMWREPR